jgi:hypothetical protein
VNLGAGSPTASKKRSRRWSATVGPGAAIAQTKREGEMKFALYVTIAPAWLELHAGKRGAMLAEIQKILHERVRFAPSGTISGRARSGSGSRTRR